MTTTQPSVQRATVRVAPLQPFDFGASLNFVASFPPIRGEQRVERDALVCAARAAGVLVAVRIGADGSDLVYEIESGEHISQAALAAITDRLSFQLGVDDDVAQFYALAEGDPAFQAVIARLHGYHQVKFPSPLELMTWAILGQRVAMPVARTMKRAIVTAFQNSITVDGEALWAFPDLEQLLTLTPDALVALIGNRRKAGYLHGAFRHRAAIDESFLREGEYEHVRERLLAIPGIGPWSASFLLIRGLGRTERIVPDKEGKRAAQRVYGRSLTDREFEQLASRYDGWQGYWGHYIRAAG